MTKIAGLLSMLIFFIFLMMVPIKAQAFDLFTSNPCDNTDAKGAKSSICQQATTQSKDKNPVAGIIQTASSIVALLAGILAVLMIIISGFTLITSAGSQDAVANSKKRITSSVVGLIIVGLAWIIIRLVTDQVIQ